MEIESIAHKPLRAFFLTGETKGVPEVERVRRMLAFLLMAEHFDRLTAPPNFGLHALTGNRKGAYAMTVTRNWRMTFSRIDDTTVGSLNLEDYH